MSQIRYFDQNGILQTRSLGKDRFVVGRVESCNLAISGDLVSREHARFDYDPDGRYRVRDLGSRNKTFVNGQQINETLLSHGDLVRIGEHILEFLDDGLPEQASDLSFLTPDRNDPAGTQWIKTKAPVALPLERIGELATIGCDAGYPARAEDLAGAALSRLLMLLGADRGFIALRGESQKEMRPVAQRGLANRPGEARVPVSQTFAYSALLQSVVGRYPEKASQVDPKSGYATAALVAPLLYKNNTVGVVYVDRPTGSNPFPESALTEIACAGAQIGSLMAEASQQLVANETAVAPAWLATLRRMQLAMTTPPEISESFDVAVKLIAGRMRCGDFCDVIHVAPNRVFVAVMDAGGQGAPGMSQANAIRTALRTALTVEGSSHDLAAIVSAINRTMTARKARQLVTATIVDVDLAGGQIRYVSAGGLPPLILVGPGRMVTLDQPSLVLGIDPSYGYEAAAVDAPSAFRLICYTDGLPELCNAAGEALGTSRLHEILLEHEAFAPPAQLVKRLSAACENHCGGAAADDDALMVVVSHG